MLSGRRRIYVVLWILAMVVVIAWAAWPSGTSQTPRRAVSGQISGPQIVTPPTDTPLSTTTTEVPGSVVNPLRSNSSESGATPVVGGATPSTGSAVPPTVAGPPTTTTSTVPPGVTINYAAYVDPRFRQDPTNPLKVTYSYSASASTVINGVSLELSSLPDGTLTLSTNGTKACSMNVGGVVTSGTCIVTFASFGKEAIVATYVTDGAEYSSAAASNDVQPFATTTVASIRGGGSLGGLEFDANVTDSNGDAVTVGSVTMTIADVTQGWSYVVTVDSTGQDGGNQSAFSCILVENDPRVGEYGGCGPSGPIIVVPASGDSLTMSATCAGTTDWTGSSSQTIAYAMP